MGKSGTSPVAAWNSGGRTRSHHAIQREPRSSQHGKARTREQGARAPRPAQEVPQGPGREARDRRTSPQGPVRARLAGPGADSPAPVPSTPEAGVNDETQEFRRTVVEIEWTDSCEIFSGWTGIEE